MSYAPKTLLDARSYILARTSLHPDAVGIVGGPGHTYGYHLGADRLPAWDYSTQTTRDRAGLTTAASALDIGDFGRLPQLRAYLVGAAKARQANDIAEIIGPGDDGRAYSWERARGFSAVGPRARGDSHEWHIHISYYRDSEYRDKVGLFRGFFEEDDDMSRFDEYRYDPGDGHGQRDLATMIADMWALQMFGHTTAGPHDDSFLLRRTKTIEADVKGLIDQIRLIEAGRVDINALVEALVPVLGPPLSQELSVLIAQRLQD